MEKLLRWLDSLLHGCNSELYTQDGLKGRCGEKIASHGMCKECLRTFKPMFRGF